MAGKIADQAANQLLGRIFDESSDSLKTTLVNAEVSIDVSAFTDSIKIGDGAGETATITNNGGKKSLDVNVTDIAISHANDSIRIGDGGSNLATVTAAGALKVDGSAVTQPVSAASLPLPTGASTEATLSNINTKTPALGQTTMSLSTPVTLASDQAAVPVKLGTLTVTGTASVVEGTPVSFDASGYKTAFVLLELNSGSGGTVDAQYESSVDGSSWTLVGFLNQGITPPPASFTESLVFAGDSQMPITRKVRINGRYFRVRLVNHSGSTAVIKATVFAVPEDSGDEFPTVSAHLVDSSGNYITSLPVTATLSAGASSIGKAEDVASANADVGVPAMAVRKATPANTSNNDSDYEMLQMSAGRLWTSTIIDAALPAGTNAIGKLAANSGTTIGAVEIAASQTVGLASGAAVIGHVINDAGSAIMGKVGIDQTTPGTTNGVQVNAALPSGTNAIGKLAANAGVTIGAVELAAAQTLTTVTTVGAVTSITNALPAGANAIGKLAANSGVDIGDVDVTSIAAGTNRLGSVRLVDSADADLTAAKGNQTSRAVGTQDLKDSGRTHINLYATAVASGTTTTETAISLNKSSGTAAVANAASFVVTSGKRFRITHFSVATRGHVTATIQTTTFNLRINAAGGVTTSSTPIVLSARSATPATASAWDRYAIPIPDGFEILGDGTLQIGITAAATFVTNAPTWDVTITGYEY